MGLETEHPSSEAFVDILHAEGTEPVFMEKDKRNKSMMIPD